MTSEKSFMMHLFFFENLNIRTIVDEADDKDKEVDLLIDTRTAKTVLIIE